MFIFSLVLMLVTYLCADHDFKKKERHVTKME